METIINPSSNHVKVYGRSYVEDLRSFFKDISVRDTFAYFKRFPIILNAQFLSDVSEMDKETATNNLECLHNIGLITLTDNGYVEKKVTQVYTEDMSNYSKEDRAKAHAEKLIQLASMYMDADSFSDMNGVYCCSQENINELHNDISKAWENFKVRDQKTPIEKKNRVLNLILGLTIKNIKPPQNEEI